MFRHHGNQRTISHNLQIATLLSFVAGFVNVTGFVSISKLTTNVTGHFAFFIDDIYHLKFQDAIIFFLLIFSFFLGAFISNFTVEWILSKGKKNIFNIPVIFEISILLTISIFGGYMVNYHPNFIAISLLLAMGMQNALVTKISNAIVRTTHLTGLFTDLGIEVSQLFFSPTETNRKKLLETIKLRLRIILFFFFGGVTAGIVYNYFGIVSLIIPSTLLILGLLYDIEKINNLKMKIKNRS